MQLQTRTHFFADKVAAVQHATLMEVRGTVTEIRGLALHVVDLPLPVGAVVRVVTGPHGGGASVRGEVIGFCEDHTLVMPFGSTSGISRGNRVVAESFSSSVRVGEGLLGRVINGLGEPIDGKGMLTDTTYRPLYHDPVDPMDRPLIDKPLATGVRAIDGFLSVGRGQRLGIFAAPGVGKSTVLGMMARHTDADVNVVALIGERGREVNDFLLNQLGEGAMQRTVVVCATGDESALLRIRAAMVANTVAEHFRDQGLDVLLIMDSVTRFCQAQRQVGLAAGEPPATRGYPPSVFSTLPVLLERSGRTRNGSITGFYSVLVEGDDMNEPIADATRGILDGHVILSRALATKGHWPAIDILQSISRVADDVTDKDHQSARALVVKLLSSYHEVEDLLNIGAYAAGSNPDFDLAIAAKPMLDRLLQQGRRDQTGPADFIKTKQMVVAAAMQLRNAQAQVNKQQQPARGR
jgi:FliI/YscN family ATPase